MTVNAANDLSGGHVGNIVGVEPFTVQSPIAHLGNVTGGNGDGFAFAALQLGKLGLVAAIRKGG